MSQPILYILYQTRWLTQLLQYALHNVYISTFIITTNVVHFSRLSIMNYQINRATVILDIKPVTNIEPVTIYRNGFIIQCPGYNQRNQFLRELKRPIVIGATCNIYGKSKCFMIGSYKQVPASFTCRVRTVWHQRCIFSK
ncbi:hypothetical protein D3C74_414330 [compost metagenome]